ncbi:MAG: acyltransferase family protein [Brevinema sp.]
MSFLYFKEHDVWSEERFIFLKLFLSMVYELNITFTHNIKGVFYTMGIFRIILAIIVAIFHMKKNLFIGPVNATESFFMISGFYIALIWGSKYTNYFSFISSRLLRLYSTYWIILVVYIVGYIHVHGIIKFITPNFFTSLYLLLSNIFLVGGDLSLWLDRSSSWEMFWVNSYHNAVHSIHSLMYITPAWSLALEIYFYLIAPFFKNKKIIIIGIICSLLLRFVMFNILDLRYDPFSYRFFFSELVFFLAGMLSFSIYQNFKSLKFYHYISLTLFITLFIFFKDNSYYKWIYMFLLFFNIPTLFFIFKNNKTDRFIGNLSYGVYLVHVAFMRTFENIFEDQKIYIFTVVMASILFSIFIELLLGYFNKWRQDKFAQRLS